MKPKWLHVLILLAVAGYLPGQQPKPQPKAQPKQVTTADGVFIGKSGKPMAGARLILCQMVEDRESLYARVRLVPGVPTANADKEGHFQFRAFTPGTYAIIYLPAGTDVLMPNEISIKSLEAVTGSIAPLLRNTELGKTDPYAPRAWGNQFTLMKGHTFWSMGAQMKIWNATVRRGQQGPYLELRRGTPWVQKLDDKTQFKFEAWSF